MNQTLLQRVQRQCLQEQYIAEPAVGPLAQLKAELDTLDRQQREEILDYLKAKTRSELLDFLQRRASA